MPTHLAVISILLTLGLSQPCVAQLFYDATNNAVYSSKTPQASFSNPHFCNDEAWTYLDYQFLDPSDYYKIHKARKMALVIDNISTNFTLTEHNFVEKSFTLRIGLPDPQYTNLKKGFKLKLIFKEIEPLIITLQNSREALGRLARQMCCKNP